MDESNVSKLLQQCKASDVDVKIDSMTKLQAEFENGATIPDADAVIQTFRACLRVSHQHLQAATLSALPPLLPLLLSNVQTRSAAPPASASASTSSAGSSSIDSYTLRQALVAFLPTGGIIDRLGDARERSREKARESLAILGGLAFRAGGGSTLTASKSGKTQETALQTYERLLKEIGLTSKAWRVREQSVLTLVDIRRAHHLFPIRPYLPMLVGALEDSDSTVPSDAARADLKRELAKKGVRKTIVDTVLTKVLGSDNASTAAGEGTEAPGTSQSQVATKKEYIPPSLALQAQKSVGGSDFPAPGPSTVSRTASHNSVKELSRPDSRAAAASPIPSGGDTTTSVQAVYVASSRDLDTEFADMLKSFEVTVTRVRGMLKGDVHTRYAETFISHLKSFIDASLKTLASLRTIVATNTCSLYNELAVALGAGLDPYVDTMLSNLLRMAGFTKKIVAQTSQATVDIIIKNTSPQPRTVVPLFWTGLQDKTPQGRLLVIEHVKVYLDFHGSRAKTMVEASGSLDTLEKCIRKALTDANAGARQNARAAFWSFEALWKERGRMVLEAQDGTSRKQLEKACPNQRDLPEVPPATPQAKKSSLAAAIAASRAKAKVIATAPPTLRHQATSAAPLPLPLSIHRELSGRATPTSPSLPRSRVSTHPPRTRTVSRNMTTMSHSRTSSGESSNSVSYPGHRVVPVPFSSPPRGSVLRQAIQTALPSSPPQPTSETVRSSVSRRSAEHQQQQQQQQQQSTSFGRSLYLPDLDDTDPAQNDLLTAISIPLPDDADSDLDMDEPNLVSFSSPYEKFPPEPQPKSRTDSLSPTSNGHQPGLDPSSGSVSPPVSLPQPDVEDALRARAEQAQSAAERLLELVEPEGVAQPPASLLLNNGTASHTAKVQIPSLMAQMRTPSTPSAAIRKQAAAFRDSPMQQGAPSLMTDMLRPTAARADGTWWRKRMALFNQRNPLFASNAIDAATELQGYITALDQGTGISCLSMPASPSPFISSAGILPSLKPELWTENRSFSRLFNALQKFLSPDKGEELLQYGLIVLWEILEYLTLPMEGHETEVFTILLTVRYSNKQQAVYGLTILHAALVSFRASPIPPSCSEETKASSYAFGLIALAKFALRLPAEVLEDELPRLKHTLVAALTDTTSLVVREAAAAAIIAAQVVLRDDAHLFALLDGLADDKKNLLTYLFDKHGVRGMTGSGSVDRLEREMRRLDGRTGTPIRAPARFLA
ncbi:clasp N terminal-domain-containing protein [Russula vinacea]|nr:clasp N terminal-domain-containing protein [Russula vinacea]